MDDDVRSCVALQAFRIRTKSLTIFINLHGAASDCRSKLSSLLLAMQIIAARPSSAEINALGSLSICS